MKIITLSDCLKMLRSSDIERNSVYIEQRKLSTYDIEELRPLFDIPVLLMFQDIKGAGIWHIYLRTKERR